MLFAVPFLSAGKTLKEKYYAGEIFITPLNWQKAQR
jgi:hypothetical protein